MNAAKAAVFFFVCWLLETTLVGRVWVFSAAAPSLLLCATVTFSWLYDKVYGLIFGIAFGLLLDLSTQPLFGVCALTFTLCCVPPFALRRFFNPERVLPLVFSALVATGIGAFVPWGIYHLFGAPLGLLPVIRTLPGLFVSQAVICMVLHLALVRTIIKHRRDRRYVGGVL